MPEQKVTGDSPPQDTKEKIRAFLTYSAVFIAVLSLILYNITRESALLLTTGLSGVGLAASYSYYFPAGRR